MALVENPQFATGSGLWSAMAIVVEEAVLILSQLLQIHAKFWGHHQQMDLEVACTSTSEEEPAQRRR